MGKTAAGNLAARAAAVAFVVLATMAGPAAAAADTAKPGPNPVGTPAAVATFTGEYVNGAPVYRLPTVTVSTSRAAALAAIEQADRMAATPVGEAAASALHATAAPAHVATAHVIVAPDRNIALDVAVAIFGTLVAIALSFALVAGRRRRRRVVLPQPREFVAAQPYLPATPAPAPVARPVSRASPAPRAAGPAFSLR